MLNPVKTHSLAMTVWETDQPTAARSRWRQRQRSAARLVTSGFVTTLAIALLAASPLVSGVLEPDGHMISPVKEFWLSWIPANASETGGGVGSSSSAHSAAAAIPLPSLQDGATASAAGSDGSATSSDAVLAAAAPAYARPANSNGINYNGGNVIMGTVNVRGDGSILPLSGLCRCPEHGSPAHALPAVVGRISMCKT